jgi:hypothetical protein
VREEGESARAVQHLLHEVFETGTGDLNHVTVWARYNGTVNAGRYATVSFYVLGSGFERPPPPAYVRRVTDRDSQVEVNLQLLQVMMRGRFLTALQQEFMEHDDFVNLFGKTQSTLQCIMSGNYEHMKERILISHPFHLQMWDKEPRLEPPVPPRHAKLYKPAHLPIANTWIAEVFEPVKMKYKEYHVMQREKEVRPVEWYFTERELPPPSAHVVLLLARHPFEDYPYKEAVIFRDFKMVQVFGIVGFSHGRRFYRTLEHTTDTNCTLHGLQPSLDDRRTTWDESKADYRYEVKNTESPLGAHHLCPCPVPCAALDAQLTVLSIPPSLRSALDGHQSRTVPVHRRQDEGDRTLGRSQRCKGEENGVGGEGAGDERR